MRSKLASRQHASKEFFMLTMRVITLSIGLCSVSIFVFAAVLILKG